MSIYTTFEMITDCRAGKPEGWIFFVTHLIQPCRTILKHYGGDEDALRRFLVDKRSVITASEPATSRHLMTRWRGALLESAGYPQRPVRHDLDLEILQEALVELMPLERQMVWLETMEYGIEESATLMHVAPDAVMRAREKAGEMLRSKMDHWWKSILFDCGPSLGAAARAAIPAEPVAFNTFIEVIDGRLTWQGRFEVDRSLSGSWHEVDHFCRVREADEVVGRAHPLSEAEAQPYLDLFGVKLPKPSLWKRMVSSR